MNSLIEYIPLQQGLRPYKKVFLGLQVHSLSIFHYNKD